MERLYTIAEVAEILGLSQKQIRNYVSHGSLPHIRIGRSIRIKESTVVEFVDSRKVGSK